MRIATSGGAHLVWAGLPTVRDANRAPFSTKANGVYRAAAESVGDGVTFFDTQHVFSNGRGGYTAFYRDGGRLIEIREGDGLHFTPAGYELLVRKVAETATEEFGLVPSAYR
jgi:hypothetical protein